MTDTPVTEIPRARTGPLRPPKERPSPRAIWHWATQAVLNWMFLLAGLVAASILLDQPPRWLPTITTVAVIAAVLHIAVMPVWRYRVHRWELSDEAAYTRTGWLTQTWTLVPISRVQTVDVTRGVLQQLFGLATVAVLTASSQGTVRVWHLEADVAQRVADDLAHRAEQVRDQAT